MKPAKKFAGLIIACFTVLIFSGRYAKAQDATPSASSAISNATPAQRALLQTSMMKTKLQLDSAQIAKVNIINLKYAEKTEPLLKGDEGKFKKMRELMAVQKDKDADLKKVFTPAQYKQYEDMKAEMKEKLMENRGKN